MKHNPESPLVKHQNLTLLNRSAREAILEKIVKNCKAKSIEEENALDWAYALLNLYRKPYTLLPSEFEREERLCMQQYEACVAFIRPV